MLAQLALNFIYLFSACAAGKPAQDTPKASPAPAASAAAPSPASSPEPEPSVSAAPSPSETAAPSAAPSMLPELEKLYKQNNDLIGWLSIAGTVVDYPVMVTPQDHDYYLSHNFSKKKDKNGLLVLQADCDPYKPGANLIIHGHKMKSGRMFGSLAKYKDASYGQKHPSIRFDTLYARGRYDIIAVFFSEFYDPNIDAFRYYRFLDAQTAEEFDDFYSSIKKLSLYDTGVEAHFGDHFITLSTCSYHKKNGRFVVVAKKAADR